LKNNKKAIIIGSLGTISKDLPDEKRVIKVKGNMGGVLGVGLGYALGIKKKVIVLIGDGSYLMKLGSMATILAHKPKNLEIIVLDNGQYASTGGHKTNFKYIRKYLKFPRVKYESIC
jgi:thiamine pyrophosphate-dependent acetolactate synthase large subunit-like protein